ncbi:MAG: hypothetical protein NC124_17055 [Clostridium sp.]|nr:hypothetical protein [Clostridium sp.]
MELDYQLISNCIIAFYVGGLAWSIVSSVSALVVGLLLGGEFGNFRFLWFSWSNVNGAVQLRKEKFSPTAVCSMKGKAITENAKGQALWEGTVLLIVMLAGISSGVWLCRNYARDSFLRQLAWMVFFFVILNVFEYIQCLFRLFGNSLTARCERANKAALAQLQEGIRPAKLTVSLDEVVELKHNYNFSLKRYVLFQYYRALDLRDQAAMRKSIYNIIHGLPENVTLSSYASFYAECVFYFAFAERNKEKAEYYFKRCPCSIEQDSDANGRRIYAYYLYYVKGDAKKALEVLKEGLAVAEDFDIKGNIPMERELLEFLQDRIQENEYQTMYAGLKA